MNIKGIFLLFTALSLLKTAYSQSVNDSIFRDHEKNITELCSALFSIRFNNTLQDSLNTQLKAELKGLLELEGSMNYPFDSVKQIGKVVSADGLVRIFTYNIVRNNGSYEHFGYLQYYSKSEKKQYLYELLDQKNSIPELENATLLPENWYGALYYQIIETKSDGEKLYTVIGLNGNNLYSIKKVIDVLYFSSNEKPKFGKSIFLVGKKKQKRIIFEYSRMASMMVKYDANLDMIVLDHLSPDSPIYTGDFKHYGPDLSYDGMKFTDGVWTFIPTIDYKAEKQKRK